MLRKTALTSFKEKKTKKLSHAQSHTIIEDTIRHSIAQMTQGTHNIKCSKVKKKVTETYLPHIT